MWFSLSLRSTEAQVRWFFSNMTLLLWFLFFMSKSVSFFPISERVHWIISLNRGINRFTLSIKEDRAKEHINKLDRQKTECTCKCWESWLMPLKGYSQQPQKGHDNQRRFLRTVKKQMSLLSSSHAGRIQGTTCQLTTSCSREDDVASCPRSHFQTYEVSCQNDVRKGKIVPGQSDSLLQGNN